MKCSLVIFFVLMFSCVYAQTLDGYDLLRKGNVPKIRTAEKTDMYSLITVVDSTQSANNLVNLEKMQVNKEYFIESASRNQFFQLLGTLLSFISDYKRAINEFDSCEYNPRLNYADSASGVIGLLSGVRMENYKKIILDSARTHSIVMINEAHHHGRHRVTTYTLLDSLFQLGYRYFGLETLSIYGYTDKEPISTKSGFYTMEPNMAELVRYAKLLGYKVFAYESDVADPLLRDSVQAVNILNHIERGNGKVLIHAGYGHIAEKSFGVPAMGAILKRMMKEDPFTIDQVDFSEGKRNSMSQGLYNVLTGRFPLSDDLPRVLFKGNKPFHFGDDHLYDIVLYTPPSTYRNGRPTWLLAENKRKRKVVTIPRSIRRKTVLVQAYLASELDILKPDQCIPMDQSYLIYNHKTDLYLRPETYSLVYRGIDNTILAKEDLIERN